ncbi:hypothetical protein D7V86_18630 [bacterium D16-51]|nr:hypothetical protein D7V96_14350 [bacterium D16-59]RKI56983.1 hypothetical protein D7V86_18630 [bacterium D16-51]
MEQVGKNFSCFLEYLLVQKPEICIHLEPIVELYEEDNIIDWCAKQFHKKGSIGWVSSCAAGIAKAGGD